MTHFAEKMAPNESLFLFGIRRFCDIMTEQGETFVNCNYSTFFSLKLFITRKILYQFLMGCSVL